LKTCRLFELYCIYTQVLEKLDKKQQSKIESTEELRICNSKGQEKTLTRGPITQRRHLDFSTNKYVYKSTWPGSSK
jgi:hypothetical protein